MTSAWVRSSKTFSNIKDSGELLSLEESLHRVWGQVEVLMRSIG